MADMEALKEQLMSMKRNGKGFLCVGTDDPEEAAEIMKIAAELSQEEEEEQYEDEEDYDEEDYEDEERTEPKKTEYVYEVDGSIYSDGGIAELVAENYEDHAVETYGNNLMSFLNDLETEDIDYLKDKLLKRLDTLPEGGRISGIRKKKVWKNSWEE